MTLAIRALIPVGYMPGDMTAGEIVVLCPTGMPAEVMQALHRGHHDHDQSVVDVDRSCPIGTALQPDFIPPDFVEIFTFVSAARSVSFYESVDYVGDVIRRYESRGPPVV